MGKLNRHTKSLGLVELIAIAIGGMVGGGIFSILGISASMIGFLTPIAIVIGGIIALFAAYSYVKLGVYYKDEGATYSFIKRTFPKKPFTASVLGWFVIFGYISTLALYSYTFAAYAISGTTYADDEWIRKSVSWGILFILKLSKANCCMKDHSDLANLIQHILKGCDLCKGYGPLLTTWSHDYMI